MNRIKPHPLWVGHAGDGRAFRKLFHEGIRAVVQLAVEEPPIATPGEFIFCRFPLLDGTGNDDGLLYLAVRSVATLLQRGIPTLVCCGSGMSRSPAIVAGALSIAEQAKLEDSLKCVTEFRPADVSPGLWAEVRRTLGNIAAEMR